MTILFITRRMSSRLILALALITSTAYAEVPPGQQRLGWDEWQTTGKFAKWISVDFAQAGYEVIFPGRIDGSTGVEMFLTATSDKSRPLLQVRPHAGVKSLESSLFQRDNSDYFQVAHLDVIPLYGHLYSIYTGSTKDGIRSITLKRITDLAPKEVRPDRKSRTIAMNSHEATLFWDVDAADKGARVYEVVKIRAIEKKTRRATVELTPWHSARGASAPVEKMPLTFEVGKGDLLTCRGRSYRVLNVVPSDYVKDEGRLVGWIELSADPVSAEKRAEESVKRP